MKLSIILGLLIITALLISGLVVLHKTSLGLRRAENSCDLEIIKSHVFSLNEVYSPEQKEQIANEVLKEKMERGEC